MITPAFLRDRHDLSPVVPTCEECGRETPTALDRVRHRAPHEGTRPYLSRAHGAYVYSAVEYGRVIGMSPRRVRERLKPVKPGPIMAAAVPELHLNEWGRQEAERRFRARVERVAKYLTRRLGRNRPHHLFTGDWATVDTSGPDPRTGLYALRFFMSGWAFGNTDNNGGSLYGYDPRERGVLLRIKEAGWSL